MNRPGQEGRFRFVLCRENAGNGTARGAAPVALQLLAARAVAGPEPAAAGLRPRRGRRRSWLGCCPARGCAAGRAVRWLWSYGAGVRAQHAQAAWRQVLAVLLADAPDAAPAGSGSWRPRVLAYWTAPDGTQRAGRVHAPVSARAGAALRVWVDASGRLTGIPLQQREVERQAALAAVLTSVGLGLVLLGAGALARRLLERRRLVAWDAAWHATGPRWTTPL